MGGRGLFSRDPGGGVMFTFFPLFSPGKGGYNAFITILCLKKDRIKACEKQNLKQCAARYPVLHFERKLHQCMYKVLAEQLAAPGFLFKKPRNPLERT